MFEAVSFAAADSGSPAAGDRRWDEFYRLHQRAVFLYLRRLVRDYHAAEDLHQETFLRAFRMLARKEAPPHPRAWLLRIAKHLVIDRRRRKKAEAFDVDFLGESAAAPDRESATKPAWRVDGREIPKSQLVEAVGEGLQSLPPNYRKVVTHRYRDGRTCWEIAVRHGLSLVSAKVRLHRGRKKLRRFLISRVRDPQFSLVTAEGEIE